MSLTAEEIATHLNDKLIRQGTPYLCKRFHSEKDVVVQSRKLYLIKKKTLKHKQKISGFSTNKYVAQSSNSTPIKTTERMEQQTHQNQFAENPLIQGSIWIMKERETELKHNLDKAYSKIEILEEKNQALKEENWELKLESSTKDRHHEVEKKEIMAEKSNVFDKLGELASSPEAMNGLAGLVGVITQAVKPAAQNSLGNIQMDEPTKLFLPLWEKMKEEYRNYVVAIINKLITDKEFNEAVAKAFQKK